MADTTGAVAHTITLYSSTISDCSARLRIGLHLKRLPYTLVDVNISRNEQLDPKYVDINEALTVPTLVIDYKTIGLDDNEERVVLTQSIAALEYLDEAFPGTHSILPPVSEPLARAKVRTLVGIIATDFHPLTTHRVGKTIQHNFPCAQFGSRKSNGKSRLGYNLDHPGTQSL
ncbi:Glutathione S-transferase, domain-containing protein [Cladophialophora immunda]|nr:Glutathione S-transferase, domain-containing protein [Cladophialophora immunda]